MDIDEAMELVKAGKATHHLVMLDKDGNFTDNEEEMATFREAVHDLEGNLIVEASGFKPDPEMLEIILSTTPKDDEDEENE